MKKNIVAGTLMLILTIMVHGEDGIKFENGLTWEQIKQKARVENKYIFIDCYATWCGPCKKMDQLVYPDPNVGKFMREKFISVKLQMDSTEGDNEEIKQWYSVVHQFTKNYNIKGYPSFLFFSPEGKLIHQDLGFKDIGDFISLAKSAVDPLLQDASILNSYENGNKDPQVLLQAAKIFKKDGNIALADSIAREYKTTYLDKLSNKELFTQDNIKFVTRDFSSLYYGDGSQGRFFNYFLAHPTEVDSLIRMKGFVTRAIKEMIKWEELTQKLISNKQVVVNEPNWDSLEFNIEKKWGKIISTKEFIADYKPTFYLYSKNWIKWMGLFEQQLKNTPPSKNGHHLNNIWGDETILNQNAWTVFLRCNDKKIMKHALKWVNLAIKLLDTTNGVQSYYDTKANLLYKGGKSKKAIKLELKAIELDNYFARRKGKNIGPNYNDFNEILIKMKAGQPTWPNGK